ILETKSAVNPAPEAETKKEEVKKEEEKKPEEKQEEKKEKQGSEKRTKKDAASKQASGAEKEEEDNGYEQCAELTPEQLKKIADEVK
uniref:Uncharacterized protein n=1 Tax=Panagrolaimus sp. JU765 TaxID=591449 RepID=A0AC34Q3Z9_9BILA